MNYAIEILNINLAALMNEREAQPDETDPIVFEIIDRKIAHINEAISVLESLNLMDSNMILESKLNFDEKDALEK